MKQFDVNILGCGSALPTLQHNPSCQVVEMCEKVFMVDCGEGSQLQYRKSKLGFGKLNQIFVSHTHGDHCFGLIGLISTLGLLGRTGDLVIHGVPDLELILKPQLDYFCKDMSYKVLTNTFDPKKSEVVYENRSMKVTTIPLEHRVPCAGFLFQEKQADRHLIREKIDFYDVPVKERVNIKQGADFVTNEGKIIPNSQLTRPADTPRSYAYCADTAYKEDIVDIIEGVDLLYHEATFTESDISRAKKTGHSTARQAAMIAKQANAKKLILGHFSSRYTDNTVLLKEAQTVFPNTILANEGLCESL
ncbi:ribonuclease Z [Dysgonomonas sp. 520]|uniref:ribonuclease Z n=1 Tax=Dysgonomonas sp. 520 TaxID=2302931 RepID=UPI0013D0AB89|nr:ribonuclease Z [Dysgonomonas sp. 520]NDW10402.1 ribonuclease Z [Dysgonomonas sp. 520]